MLPASEALKYRFNTELPYGSAEISPGAALQLEGNSLLYLAESLSRRNLGVFVIPDQNYAGVAHKLAYVGIKKGSPAETIFDDIANRPDMTALNAAFVARYLHRADSNTNVSKDIGKSQWAPEIKAAVLAYFKENRALKLTDRTMWKRENAIQQNMKEAIKLHLDAMELVKDQPERLQALDNNQPIMSGEEIRQLVEMAIEDYLAAH